MNPQRFKEAFDRLESLDERLTYKLKSQSSSIYRASTEQLEERCKHLSAYTIELKEIMRELFLALGTKG